MYCYFNNGLSMRAVEPDYAAAEGEVLFDSLPTAEQLAEAFQQYQSLMQKDSIKAQIIALESTVTQRRIREANLGTDNGWMANLDGQIAALRSQLQ